MKNQIKKKVRIILTDDVKRSVANDINKAGLKTLEKIEANNSFSIRLRNLSRNGISKDSLVAGGVVVGYLISACFGNMQYSTYPFFCIFIGSLVYEIHKK